jgi:hypothetical protein
MPIIDRRGSCPCDIFLLPTYATLLVEAILKHKTEENLDGFVFCRNEGFASGKANTHTIVCKNDAAVWRSSGFLIGKFLPIPEFFIYSAGQRRTVSLRNLVGLTLQQARSHI